MSERPGVLPVGPGRVSGTIRTRDQWPFCSWLVREMVELVGGALCPSGRIRGAMGHNRAAGAGDRSGEPRRRSPVRTGKHPGSRGYWLRDDLLTGVWQDGSAAMSLRGRAASGGLRASDLATGARKGPCYLGLVVASPARRPSTTLGRRRRSNRTTEDVPEKSPRSNDDQREY